MKGLLIKWFLSYFNLSLSDVCVKILIPPQTLEQFSDKIKRRFRLEFVSFVAVWKSSLPMFQLPVQNGSWVVVGVAIVVTSVSLSKLSAAGRSINVDDDVVVAFIRSSGILQWNLSSQNSRNLQVDNFPSIVVATKRTKLLPWIPMVFKRIQSEIIVVERLDCGRVNSDGNRSNCLLFQAFDDILSVGPSIRTNDQKTVGDVEKFDGVQKSPHCHSLAKAHDDVCRKNFH
jgi:hypothetical protein